MRVRPIRLTEARAFVVEHHRHNGPPISWFFGCGLEHDGRIVGIAMAGRPVARELDDGWNVEITRCTTTGERNACSMLYGSLCRAAKALGYAKAYTYTLASEPGSSLMAAGFVRDAIVPAAPSWWRPGRPRYEENLFGERLTPHSEDKVRWRRDLATSCTGEEQDSQTPLEQPGYADAGRCMRRHQEGEGTR